MVNNFSQLRWHRTNKGPQGAALRFNWQISDFAVQTSQRLLQHFGRFGEKNNNKITQIHSGRAARPRALERVQVKKRGTQEEERHCLTVMGHCVIFGDFAKEQRYQMVTF